MQLPEFKEYFDPRFRAILQGHIQATASLTADPFLRQLVQYGGEVAGHGKRLRPYMAALGYVAGGWKNEEALFELAAGVELFHTFCLIHDDVIDRAKTRHGVKTVEAYALSELQARGRLGDLEQNGRSQAILVGDLFFGWATKSIMAAGSRTGNSAEVAEHFFRVANEVIMGQMIDVDTMTREEQGEEILFEKFRLKTATYSFVRPFMLGLALAGVKDAALFRAAEDIGRPLGIAFQIQDDNLDVTSTEEKLGKPVFSDLAEGQQTLLTTYIYSQPEYKKKLVSLMRQPTSASIQAEARTLFEASGAIAYASKRADELFAESQQAIAGSPFTSDVQNSLTQLLELIKGRSS